MNMHQNLSWIPIATQLLFDESGRVLVIIFGKTFPYNNITNLAKGPITRLMSE